MKDNSVRVKTIDEFEAKKQLKNCPELVRDYVKALESSRDGYKRLSEEKIKKLKWQSKVL